MENKPESNKCPECGVLLSLCQCEGEVSLHSESFRPVLSVETTGKPDHVFTVIEKLPKAEPFLRALLKKLAAECESKGTFRVESRYGLIQLHGDKRIALRAFLDREGISYIG